MSHKFSRLRVPTLKESLAIAAVIALIGFFSIRLYYPPLGIIGNAMNGYIKITDECPRAFPTDLMSFSSPTYTPPQPFLCGLGFPYRWVLIALVLLVAGCGYWEHRKKV